MLVQAERDRAAGLRTSGFVSGYRGSPLGTLDTAFANAGAVVRDAGIVVQPAVNEELAATAIAGTQQIERSPGARVQGVFSLWYGKGPGLDRAADALRHGNMQGSSPHGGVVVAVGDDHLAKSSSIACYSDETVASLQMPLFVPADPAEIVFYGLHAFALSRMTGSWAALKIITEVADSTRAVDAAVQNAEFVVPPMAIPPSGLHNRWPDTALEQEMRQQEHRLPAAIEYVRANKLDRAFLKSSNSVIGIVSAGKSWFDTREALRLLGLDDARLEALGIALYKPAVVWPLEPTGLAAFAEGLTSLIVLEEKAPLLEGQIKSILYGRAGAPRVWGKTGPDGSPLFPKTGDITPERAALGLGRLLYEHSGDERLAAAVNWAEGASRAQVAHALPSAVRKPYFCSGCPHNRSTVTPEGSRTIAGIGCHGLAAFNRPRTEPFGQMGGEGVQWMGLQPFTDEEHIFVNLGDGTYFHSGILAVRQAVAAKLNITYRLLLNGAVAMTGGQSVDGELSIYSLVSQLKAEGVSTVVLSTDTPERYPPGDPLHFLVERISHRDDLDADMHSLRERKGVSVIVYEQMCATEKRRLRKRGKLYDPTTRLFINEFVCEGCGDCSAKSNCLSVEPIQTEYGVKRRINQSSCNKDYSCGNGFCPSFVSVEGGRLRRPKVVDQGDALAPLPPPALTPSVHQRLVVAGIGGTGVVTIGALTAMSAHIAGRKAAVLDQVGMAQKGGGVTSHIHVADDEILALRIPAGQADLVLVCDQIVGNTRDVITAIESGRTNLLVNADVSITGDFTQNSDAVADPSLLARRLMNAAGERHFSAFPFTTLAERLFGDSIASNLMMVGAAYQKGWLNLDPSAFTAAIELNGVGVEMNVAAFEWGRRLAVEPDAVYRAAGIGVGEPETLDDVIARRAAFLRDYQDAAYAQRFLDLVAEARGAEALVSGETAFTEAVVRSLFKLMAYKDEYEVARLFTGDAFAQSLASQFEGDVKLSFHLAPPILGNRDRRTGELRKQKFGSWMMSAFKVLAKAKRLRGTPWDVFGYSTERRTERGLIIEYVTLISRLGKKLSGTNLQAAVAIAALPMSIRGYGQVKDRNVALYRAHLTKSLAEWDALHAAPANTAVADPAACAGSGT
jgi:indolepyruvate ferredoxin oxidoreductase